MNIERVAVESLSVDPANVRLHPKRNLETIKASLQRFGQRKPIVVSKDNVVIAGNGTLRAMQDLKWKEVDIVRAEDLEGSEAIAFSIADNRSAELAEWDFENLSAILKQLAKEDFDFKAIGWDEHEVEGLLEADFGGFNEEESKDDAEWSEEEEEDTKRILKFNEIDFEVVKQSIKLLRFREQNEEITDAKAVTLICAVWLEENS